jgi:5'-nucleotidase / UDP-sugar diphosphatase
VKLFSRPPRLVLALCVVALVGCAGIAGDSSKPLQLRVTHINDHHSNLETLKNFELRVDGVPTRVDLGGFARINTVIRENSRQPASLKVHAGDAQTGTLFHTMFKGRADADLMNSVCFDTFTLGNHEFDYGDQALSSFLTDLRSDKNCKTDVLSANVLPKVGTPLAPKTTRDYFQPYVIKQFSGVKVGIVGLTIKGKTVRSSRPLETTTFLEELEAASAAIAELKAMGVKRIILSTHIGYGNDLALVQKLPEVDVVIGGDSHSLLGSDELKAFGLTPSGPYPTVARNADGAQVCVATAWEYSKAVGVLDVDFDEAGRVSRCGGRLVIPTGDNFQQRDAAGKWVPVAPEKQSALSARIDASANFKVVVPDLHAAALVKKYSDELGTSLSRKLGVAPQGFCHVRVPGSPAANGCGPEGSDAAQYVAEGFLQASRRAHFSLQNAGGVRVAIPQGDISYDTAYRVLPFANTLIEMEITGAEIKSALEDAVSSHLDPVNGVKGSDGSHPYAAGLRWSLDMSQSKGNRFSNLEIRDRANGQWLSLQANQRYVMVTNDFIASGKDGYATLGAIFKDRDRWVDTGLYYTQTFIDFIASKNGQLNKIGAEEYSHRSLVSASGAKLR